MAGTLSAPGAGQLVEVFRVIPRLELLRSSADVARFHVRSDPPTSYLSRIPRTAVFEVSQGRRAVTPDGHRLLRVAARLTAMINLCDERERRYIGLTEEEIFGPKVLGDPSHEARLLVAHEARTARVQGIWYPSRLDGPHGANIVVFLENAPVGRLQDGAALEILDRDDAPEQSALAAVLDEIRMTFGPHWVDLIRAKASR